MKIALFSETYPPYINGVATHVAMLKETFEKMGHEVLVITVGAEKQKDIEIKDGVVYVPGILIKRIYGYRLASPISPSRTQLAIDFKPDIVHIHNEFGIAETGLRVAKKENLPIIYTLHSQYDEFIYNTGMKYIKKAAAEITLKFILRFADNSDVIVSPSQKAQYYLDKQNVDKKVVVVDNAVEFAHFQTSPEKEAFRKEFRAKYNLSDKTKAFVFVGRVCGEKGVKELVDNWIYSNFSREDAVLFIIGKGPISEEITQYVEEKGWSDRIIMYGAVPNVEIHKYLYAMDYYTTASLSEMHSISMLEAMASGLPALIKLDPPNKDQIVEAFNGFQWDSPEDFKELFTRIINLSEEDAKQLKANVLRYSRENDNFAQAKRLLEIYEEAIERKKKENL
ncbi:glycosyltransferase [Peptoniphilaceae bacterium SGI.131]